MRISHHRRTNIEKCISRVLGLQPQTNGVGYLQRNYLHPLNVDLPVFIFTGFMRWKAFETTQKCNGLINQINVIKQHQTTSVITKGESVFQDPSTFIISHYSNTFTVIIQNAFSFSSFFDLNRCPNCFWCSSW